jgi:hypothetical protein
MDADETEANIPNRILNRIENWETIEIIVLDEDEDEVLYCSSRGTLNVKNHN